MTTFREAVYMVIDLLKQVSDDSYYTEEHIMFLLSKVRANLITRKYRTSRNQSFTVVDKANYQEIRFPIEKMSGLGVGEWYISSPGRTVPHILPVGIPQAFTDRNVRNENVSVVLPERLPFVGYNKWLHKSIFCSVSDDNRLVVRQMPESTEDLSSITLFVIYENCLDSTPRSCDPVDMASSDIMDRRFPLEESLLSVCIESVAQEISGSKFTPEDRANNGKDDMSDVGRPQRTSSPVTEDNKAYE